MEVFEAKDFGKDVLDEVVRRIVSAVNPVKIILFGSWACGKQRKDSDIDILVVVEDSNLPRYKRSAVIDKALAGILIPKDIVVYTQKEIDEWKDIPFSFVSTVLKYGKVIFERK